MPVPIVDAHFYHNSNKLMHFPTVDDIFSLNSNTLMLIPTNWCKFQHVDANSNKLMHIPTVDAYFLSINKFCLIFPQKKGTELILTTKQRLPKLDMLMHIPTI